MANLTGPQNCTECGTEFTEEIILDGGSHPAYVIIRGHMVTIPGLYRCTGCAVQIASGDLESGVTLEGALAFLDDVWGPQLMGAGLMSALTGDEDMAEKVAGKLADVMEVSLVLEGVIMLQDEPGGLDFIPECTGNCGHEDEPVASHPREKAAMN